MSLHISSLPHLSKHTANIPLRMPFFNENTLSVRPKKVAVVLNDQYNSHPCLLSETRMISAISFNIHYTANYLLTECDNNLMSGAVTDNRDHAAVISFAVYSEALNALLYMVRVLDLDVVGVASELSGSCEAVPC